MMATFTICERFLLELDKDRFLGVEPNDNMCHHVSSLEWLG
jgi:hypothetical protein